MSELRALLRYLNDHLAGSDAALELLERLAKTADGDAARAPFEAMHAEIESDQRLLRHLIAKIGEESQLKRAFGWLAEKASRLKVGATAGNESFALFESLEILALGIQGKQGLWRALATLDADEPFLSDVDLPELLRRAEAQHAQVESWRLAVARSALLGC